MNDALIQLQGITRRFEVGGHPVHALDGVDLNIASGDYLAIMGPSGSGKSTLLNILGCLDRPTEGTYRLDGIEVASMDERALSRVRGRKIGFVFQSFQLVPRLKAFQNVELPMVFAGMEPAERRQKTEAALRAVGLWDRRDHRPVEMSGGEQQRVAIARSIVMGPSILLADEPTGNLDSGSGNEIVALIEGLNRNGLTLVIVTHDIAIGERAPRLIQLRDGKILSNGRPS